MGINMKIEEIRSTPQLLKQFIEDMLVSHTAFSQNQKTLEKLFLNASIIRESIGLFVAGESRTGKTRLFKEFAAEHPSYRTPEGKVVPVLFLEAPSTPNAGGLTSEILAAYGDNSADTGTLVNKTRRVVNYTERCQTKIIIIDEIQHLVDKTANFTVIHQLTDSLKQLFNKTRIVIVIGGLPYAEALLIQNEQLKGRMNGSIYLPRFNWQDDMLRSEFLGLMDGFSELLSLKFTLPELGNEELAYRFYIASGGVIGYVFNILRASAWNVIDKGRTNIMIEDIDAGYLNVTSPIDLHLTSPFSRKFNLTDELAFKKASTIGKRADGYKLEEISQIYKPKSTREALS